MTLGILLTCFCVAVLYTQPGRSQDVSLFPSVRLVSTVGGDADFSCLSAGNRIVSVKWLVNGSGLTYPLPDNIEELFGANVGIGQLRFYNLSLVYNMTKIRCVANFSTGQIFQTSDTTILLLQGKLHAVGSLGRTALDSVIFLNWTAPFSLDITGVDPDIEGYCIDVVNASSDSTVNSTCGIQQTEYSYPKPMDSICHIYFFIVTPVNQAGNGISRRIAYFDVNIYPELESISATSNQIMLFMSASVCEFQVTCLDVDTAEAIVIRDTLSLVGNTITFNKEELRSNRKYNVSIRAKNAAGTIISNTEINTHDVISLVISDEEIITRYSEYSNASGALFSFVFLTEDGGVDLSRSALLALDRNTSLNHTLPFNLHPGHYRVYVYDIEQDGTLSKGVQYPAAKTNLTIENGMFLQQLDFLCTLRSSSHVIQATCSSLGTGFQLIAQLSNASEVQKLYVNQSMDPHTPVTVEVERDGLYRVTIFSAQSGIIDSAMKYVGQVQVVIDVPTGNISTSTTPLATPPTTVPEFVVVVVVIVVIVIMVIVIMVVVVVKVVWRTKDTSISEPVQAISEPVQEASTATTAFSKETFKYLQSPEKDDTDASNSFAEERRSPFTEVVAAVEETQVTYFSNIHRDASNHIGHGEQDDSPNPSDPVGFPNLASQSTAAPGDEIPQAAQS